LRRAGRHRQAAGPDLEAPGLRRRRERMGRRAGLSPASRPWADFGQQEAPVGALRGLHLPDTRDGYGAPMRILHLTDTHLYGDPSARHYDRIDTTAALAGVL